MDRPVRKPIRLKNYDYSSPGAYFITVCTREKRCILSSIAAPPGGGVGEGLAPPAVILTGTGSLIEKQLLRLPKRFPDLTLDRYVIMPNHIHLLLTIKSGAGGAGGASPSPTTKSDVAGAIGAFKSLCTHEWHRMGFTGPLWQRSFYDHIVRNEAEYREIAEYIDANPARWKSGTLPPGADESGPVFPQPRHWRAESEAGPPMANAARRIRGQVLFGDMKHPPAGV